MYSTVLDSEVNWVNKIIERAEAAEILETITWRHFFYVNIFQEQKTNPERRY